MYVLVASVLGAVTWAVGTNAIHTGSEAFTELLRTGIDTEWLAPLFSITFIRIGLGLGLGLLGLGLG